MNSWTIAAVLASTVTIAHAQEAHSVASNDRVPEPERVLGDHVFLAPAFMPTPFLSHHVGLQQGVTQVTIDDFAITEDLRLDVELLGLRERIEAGVHVVDPLELFGFVGGEILSGSSSRSVIAAGGNVLYSGGLGGRLRLFRSTKSGTQLTLRAHGAVGQGALIDFLRLVDALADDPDAGFSAVTNRQLGEVVRGDTSRWEVGGQLLAAQALGRNFGVQGALGLSYAAFTMELYDPQLNRESERELNSLAPIASLIAGANTTPFLPLGVMLEYTVQSNREVLAGAEDADWTDPQHVLGIGIHNVHPNVQVGLTFARVFNMAPITTTDPTTGAELTSGTPVVHYVQLGLEVSW